MACGGGEGTEPSAAQLKKRLNSLPYAVEFRDVPYSGSGEVVAGTATDEDGVEVDFILTLGDPEFDQPGLRSDGVLINRGGGEDFGHWVDSNRTRKHQRIGEKIVQALCVTATGERCGI